MIGHETLPYRPSADPLDPLLDMRIVPSVLASIMPVPEPPLEIMSGATMFVFGRWDSGMISSVVAESHDPPPIRTPLTWTVQENAPQRTDTVPLLNDCWINWLRVTESFRP